MDKKTGNCVNVRFYANVICIQTIKVGFSFFLNNLNEEKDTHTHTHTHTCRKKQMRPFSKKPSDQLHR